MTLKYYGTAAAEGVPAMFCTCPICQKARKEGGRNIRSRSQALVDDHLLIDFPPDTFWHVAQQGLDLPAITALLITHNHSDHLYAMDLDMRRPGFAHAGAIDTPPSAPLRIFGSEAVCSEIMRLEEYERLTNGTLTLTTVHAFTPFILDGYTITALTANHSKPTGPLIYLIEKDGKALLYANDTGYFPEETWEYLAAAKPLLSFASLDCTGITRNYRNGHMGIEVNLEVRDRLRSIGCADDKTIFCHHHFSHNGLLTYDEQVPLAEKEGFLVSYDGMEISF